ncbi:MAG: ABC transporter substrate-binding protein [Gammaproteobacteria bacterium]|nr:ABC transporter substrate-binding protein [Gammaproteobacteria bacterium]
MKTLVIGAALLACCAAAAAPHARDDAGQLVDLAQPAQRIITLAPHAAELVDAAGAGDRLVGISAATVRPPGATEVAVVGGAGALDRERLLMLQPDLVIAWRSGNRATDLAWLRTLDVPLFISEPASLADISRSIRAIGVLAGTSDAANTAAQAFDRAIDTPCLGLPPQPAYVSVWERPRLSLGGRHWLNDVLAHAGLINVFARLDRAVIAVSDEASAAYESLPRVSLARRFDGSEDDRLADLLARPGPALAQATRLLCRRSLASRGMVDRRH